MATGKKKKESDPVTGPVWPRGWVEVQLYSSLTVTMAMMVIIVIKVIPCLFQEYMFIQMQSC